MVGSSNSESHIPKTGSSVYRPPEISGCIQKTSQKLLKIPQPILPQWYDREVVCSDPESEERDHCNLICTLDLGSLDLLHIQSFDLAVSACMG